MTNRKSHMGFRLTPRSTTLDDLELYKFQFSENFLGFRRFRTQQHLNRPALSATTLLAHQIGAMFGILSHRAGLSAAAGLSCFKLAYT